MKNLRVRTKIILSFMLVSLIILASGFYSYSSISMLGKEIHEIGIVDVPLADATMEIKLAGTTAHLIIEEVIAGAADATEMEEAMILINEAIWYANAIKNGGSNEEGTYVPIENDNVAQIMDSIIMDLTEFKNIAQVRFENINSNDFNTTSVDLDAEFDKTFSTFIHDADKAEEMIKEEIHKDVEHAQEDAQNGKIVALGSVGFTILLSVAIGLYLSRILTKPINEMVAVSSMLAVGDMTQDFKYESRDEIGILAQSFRDMIANMKQQAEVAYKIANGDFSAEVEVKSDNDVVNKNFELMLRNINALSSEASQLVVEAKHGNLQVRGDDKLFEGGWQELILQLNELIDTVERPIGYVSSYIQDMAAGNPLQKVVDSKSNESEYVDALTGQTTQVFKNTYEGSFGQMIDNLASVRTSLYSMLDGAIQLSSKATQGDLTFRADTSMLQGGWNDIISGFNAAIDTIVEPIDEAATVLEAMSNGNLHTRVNGDYKGDHARIKNALNTTIESQLRYIEEISYTLSEMARGNMNLEIEQEYAGDFNEIKTSLNTILDSLNQVLNEINSSSVQVATGATQVSESAQRLSLGASGQSSTLEEITSSMSDISTQTHANADRAVKAQELSKSVHENATHGDDQMKEMLNAMQDINESSANISNIIKVIDEIAFQTNILALNAAVEAARAGEHGKGFAVVAEEVRNLAARSANAAKETTELIENSIEKVQDGTKIAQRTSEALVRIVDGIGKTTDIVNSIATASAEQSAAITQINDGINQVTGVTQENAAASQESAAASEEMASQADTLNEMISTFTLRSQMNHGQDNSSNKVRSMVKTNRSSVDTIQALRITLDDEDFGKY